MAADLWSVVYIKTPVTGDWTQAIYTKQRQKISSNRPQLIRRKINDTQWINDTQRNMKLMTWTIITIHNETHNCRQIVVVTAATTQNI